MKKLLTFLIALIISSISYGATRTWNTGSGDWQVVANWTTTAPDPAGLPGPGDEIRIPLSSSIDIYNIPNVTIEHMFITRVSGTNTVTFKGASDGVTITFDNVSTAVHPYDVAIENRISLNCNFSGARVKIVCSPSTRFVVRGTTSAGTSGNFYPALYDPCSTAKGFVLQASSSQHAEFIQEAYASNSVQGWVDYRWSMSKFHYWSSPVTSSPAIALQGEYCRKANCLCFLAGNNVRDFDPTLGATGDWGTWMGNYPDCFVAPLDFTIGKGMEIYALNTGGSVFGNFNTFPAYTFLPLSTAINKWNLVGNPFPSGIKFTKNTGSLLIGWDWDETVVSPWVCYWDNTINDTRYYNWYATPPVAIPPYNAITNPNPDVIPRSQGFFVYSIDASPALGVNNDAREFFVNKNIGKSVSELATNQLYLKLTDGVNVPDYCVVQFNDNGSVNYGSNDMLKFFVNDGVKSEIYCKKADNQEVILNTLKNSNGNISVPVYLNVGNSGSYTITAEQISTFGSNCGILLHDNVTNATIDLKTVGSYTFSATAGDDSGRFILFFTDVLAVNNITASNFKIYSSGSSIYIQNNGSGLNGNVYMYDILGRELMNVKLTGDVLTKLNTSFERGYYIVSVKTAQGLVTEKVYIN